MSSSRSAIDEALSPDNLEELSELMFSEEKPQGKGKGEQPDTQKVRQNAGSEEKDDVDSGRSEGKGHSEASAAGKQHQGDSHQNRGAAGHSLKNSGHRPEGHPSNSDVKQPNVNRPRKHRRASERPTFTIGADQMATLRVVGSSRTDPLGSSASEIARRLFDLFGYNGSHPVASFHGETLDEGLYVPGPLIEECQWEDLLQKAGEMATASNTFSEESPEGESLDEDESRLACVSFLVQEALYEAGFGDRRRRRKDPF